MEEAHPGKGSTRGSPDRYRLEISGWDATLEPGVDLLDRDRLLDFMEGS